MLIAITIPMARRISAADADRGVFRFLMASLAVRLGIGAVVRYIVTFGVYGAADAQRYHREGTEIAESFRDGVFTNLGSLRATRFIEVLTGSVYSISGPSKLGGFLVYAWFGFLGSMLFYRAFRLAYPTGDARRYRYLVFLWPSIVYWPSSIGKDAYMLLVLGAAAYGVAKICTGSLRGLTWLALGLAGRRRSCDPTSP